jgi:hypothetical protein
MRYEEILKSPNADYAVLGYICEGRLQVDLASATSSAGSHENVDSGKLVGLSAQRQPCPAHLDEWRPGGEHGYAYTGRNSRDRKAQDNCCVPPHPSTQQFPRVMRSAHCSLSPEGGSAAGQFDEFDHFGSVSSRMVGSTGFIATARNKRSAAVKKRRTFVP